MRYGCYHFDFQLIEQTNFKGLNKTKEETKKKERKGRKEGGVEEKDEETR